MTTIHIAGDWLEAVRVSLGREADLVGRFESAMPAGYDELNDPTIAALDFVNIDALPPVRRGDLHRSPAAGRRTWRFRIYRRGDPIPLADMLPLLDHLGLRALDERAFGFAVRRMHGVAARRRRGRSAPARSSPRTVRAEVQRTFLAEFAGHRRGRRAQPAGAARRPHRSPGRGAARLLPLPAPDRLPVQPAVHRGDAGSPRVDQPRCSSRCSTARFDPAAVDDATTRRRTSRAEIWPRRSTPCPASTTTARCARLLALIDATVRTNAFRPADDGGHRPVLAFKLDPTQVPDLPAAAADVRDLGVLAARRGRAPAQRADRPRRPALERSAGGLPHRDPRPGQGPDREERGDRADRRQGRLRGEAAAAPDADEFRAEGVACYRQFISGLLDLTDNIVGGAVVPPPDTVRHDGDDPYLVVAADKGTATFSDIANEISGVVRLLARRRLRLRRQRRLRPQGDGHHGPRRVGERAPPCPGARQGRRPRRAHRSSASATCPATCSATGCCGREHVQLVAAFDHRHVFLDPDPDPAVSFAERTPPVRAARGRAGPTTTPALISAGGGVYPRTLKTHRRSAPEARERLGHRRTARSRRTS